MGICFIGRLRSQGFFGGFFGQESFGAFLGTFYKVTKRLATAVFFPGVFLVSFFVSFPLQYLQCED